MGKKSHYIVAILANGQGDAMLYRIKINAMNNNNKQAQYISIEPCQSIEIRPDRCRTGGLVHLVSGQPSSGISAVPLTSSHPLTL